MKPAPRVKRIVLSLLLVASGYLLFTAFPSSAQTAPASSSSAVTPNSYAAPNTNADVPKNLHTWTQNVMIETMAALTCQLAGIDPVNPNQQCLGVDQKTGQIGFVENGGGAIGIMGNMITMLYSPPIHSKDYFQNLAGNFGLVKPAYAQTGIGFNQLIPLLPIWTAFRNIVYLLFVLVFVIIGIAIMLRIKIDPRTVMTIQNQIPKIVVGLVLVTFSFAIAGFLIDIMYTSIYLIYGVFVGLPKEVATNLDTLNPAALQGKNAFAAAGGLGGVLNITLSAASAVRDVITPLFLNNPAGKLLGAAIGGAFGFGVGNTTGLNNLLQAGGVATGIGLCTATGAGIFLIPVCAAAGGFVGNFASTVLSAGAGAIFSNEVLGTVASVIAFLIIAIAILFALFRLWLVLLTAYIFLLLDIVFAPFWIFAGLLPGSPVSFGLWIRDILSNLSAFPTTIVMFLLGRTMINAFNSSQGTLFVPPLIGNPSGGEASPIGPLIGLGFILLTPRVVEMTKNTLKAPKFDTTPIRRALGAGAAVPTGTIRSTAAGYAATHYDITGQAVTARSQRLALGFRRLVGL